MKIVFRPDLNEPLLSAIIVTITVTICVIMALVLVRGHCFYDSNLICADP